MSGDLYPCIVCGEPVHAALMQEHYQIRHPEEGQVETKNNGVTYSETIRVLAFVIALLPILIPANIILWRVATGAW